MVSVESPCLYFPVPSSDDEAGLRCLLGLDGGQRPVSHGEGGGARGVRGRGPGDGLGPGPAGLGS